MVLVHSVVGVACLLEETHDSFMSIPLNMATEFELGCCKVMLNFLELLNDCFIAMWKMNRRTKQEEGKTKIPFDTPIE